MRVRQTTLPLLDNAFSQRVNAVIQKTREMRRGVYYPHLYVVKEDGEPPLRLWALSCLIQDRADVLPSYQQFISQLRDKVRPVSLRAFGDLTEADGFLCCGRSTARAIKHSWSRRWRRQGAVETGVR